MVLPLWSHDSRRRSDLIVKARAILSRGWDLLSRLFLILLRCNNGVTRTKSQPHKKKWPDDTRPTPDASSVFRPTYRSSYNRWITNHVELIDVVALTSKGTSSLTEFRDIIADVIQIWCENGRGLRWHARRGSAHRRRVGRHVYKAPRFLRAAVALQLALGGSRPRARTLRVHNTVSEHVFYYCQIALNNIFRSIFFKSI